MAFSLLHSENSIDFGRWEKLWVSASQIRVVISVEYPPPSIYDLKDLLDALIWNR
jgi:hypothetical protein